MLAYDNFGVTFKSFGFLLFQAADGASLVLALCGQGDQIGRNFAVWVHFYVFGRIFQTKITQNSPKLALDLDYFLS
jgi:hypothetical protein